MGEYAQRLDDKGRLVVPSRLREDLGEHFVVTKGLDACLFVYPAAQWEQIVAKLSALPATSANARAFARLFLAGAQELEADRQGRVTLPPRLREYAGIDREVVLVGLLSRLELWAADRWEAYQAKEQATFESVAETLDDLGF